MDETRKLLLAACRHLLMLQDRLIDLATTPKQYPNGKWQTKPTWAIRDLKPPSPWLEGCPTNTAASGVIAAIRRVITHLLVMVEADGPIDGKQACLVLQHLTMGAMNSEWGGPVKRLAARLRIDLPSDPRDWTHGASLR